MRQRITQSLSLVATATLLFAQAPVSQRTFGTPKEAMDAIVEAAEHNDSAAMMKILGPEGKEIMEPGDQAKQDRADFARMAHEKMEIEQDRTNPGRATFVVGSQSWPFPIPLVRNKAGQWRFDTAAGKMEVLARRIGRNELNAVEVCRGYVEAQMEYAARDREGRHMLTYAQHIVSTAGKHDGLYWEGAPENLVPKSFAGAAEAAAESTSGKREPYHGYYYRILKAQGPAAEGGATSYLVKGDMIGGFALIAYPAEYGVSGVKSFIVNHRGLVYEKDLGAATTTLARQMTQFNPDRSWHPVEKE